MEDNEISALTIGKLSQVLKQKGCSSVSGLALNENVVSAFHANGYINFKRKQKPVYIKDPKNNLEGVQLNTWHMQYTEGDKSYRDL